MIHVMLINIAPVPLISQYNLYIGDLFTNRYYIYKTLADTFFIFFSKNKLCHICTYTHSEFNKYAENKNFNPTVIYLEQKYL